MTRQHFEGLAGVVVALELPVLEHLGVNATAEDRKLAEVRDRLIRELCRWCRWQNDRFDPERFRRACGGGR